MCKIDWMTTAEETYLDEIETISNKWSEKYIEQFIDLVGDWILKLGSGVLTGKPSDLEDVRILVVSEQTSLDIKFLKKNKELNYLLFGTIKLSLRLMINI